MKNLIIWTVIIEVVLTSVFLFQFRESWQENYTKESNYYSIEVWQGDSDLKALILDDLIHAYVYPEYPTILVYEYLRVFEEIVSYVTIENPAPRLLHLGGGGYSFPRYMETVYPESVNEVVEIDPAVTQVVYEELGLPLETSIKTYNQDARLFLIQRKTGAKYNIVIGDAFNDKSTPYHLTTLEFDKLLKANMEEDGIYLVNIIDDYHHARYMPSCIHTLRHAFDYVYLFSVGRSWDEVVETSTFIIAATDRRIDLDDYKKFVTEDGTNYPCGYPHHEIKLEEYLAEREPILLTDDHAPTDILVAPIFQ